MFYGIGTEQIMRIKCHLNSRSTCRNSTGEKIHFASLALVVKSLFCCYTTNAIYAEVILCVVVTVLFSGEGAYATVDIMTPQQNTSKVYMKIVCSHMATVVYRLILVIIVWVDIQATFEVVMIFHPHPICIWTQCLFFKLDMVGHLCHIEK